MFSINSRVSFREPERAESSSGFVKAHLRTTAAVCPRQPHVTLRMYAFAVSLIWWASRGVASSWAIRSSASAGASNGT